MRVPIVAGNWKMYTSLPQALALVREMKEGLEKISGVEIVLCPPYISLTLVKELLGDSPIKLGSQNMYFEDQGAYTGEVSPLMLQGLCHYVILGHSERRHYFGEGDELINKKVKAALRSGLKPILCLGERLEERETGKTQEVVGRQLRKGLEGIASPQGLVLAYEPVWAIGTGRAASGEDANSVIGLLRQLLAELWGGEMAQGIRIQYGGSVTPENIAEFISQPEIDGALVGGASLKGQGFLSIVRQTAIMKGR